MTATEEFVRKVLAKQNPDETTVRAVAAKIDGSLRFLKQKGGAAESKLASNERPDRHP